MDPQTNLPDLVEDLEVNIDELSDTLQPLLSTPLHTIASSLPLLDKAKLYTLAAYTIESLLFSTLQASGANAKDHAIFAELARLKGYFGKIKDVEARGAKDDNEGRARLDVGAAQRFIKHGLAGNERYDRERAERAAKEKARAQLKARQINKKFDDDGKEVQDGVVTPKKRAVEEIDAEEEEEDDEILAGLDEDRAAEPPTKKSRVLAEDVMDIDSAPTFQGSASTTNKGKKKKGKKVAKHSAEDSGAQGTEDTTTPATNNDTAPESSAKKRGRKSKQSSLVENAETASPATNLRDSKRHRKHRLGRQTTGEEEQEEAILPSSDTPRTRSEMFNALLDGSVVDKQKQKQTEKRTGKERGQGKGK